jgi:hypothetical protein
MPIQRHIVTQTQWYPVVTTLRLDCCFTTIAKSTTRTSNWGLTIDKILYRFPALQHLQLLNPPKPKPRGQPERERGKVSLTLHP